MRLFPRKKKKEKKPRRKIIRLEEKEKKEPFKLKVMRLMLYRYPQLGKWYVDKFNIGFLIEQANITEVPLFYAFKIIYYAVISGVVGLVAGIALSLVLIMVLGLHPVIAVPVILGLTLLLPVMVLLGGVLNLKGKISDRAKGVDTEMPFFAVYVASMAEAGISPEKIVEKIAETRLFKYIRREAKMIVRNMKVFGLDPFTAIDLVARHHPSDAFRKFMSGYVSTVSRGGEVTTYLRSSVESFFRERSNALKRLSDNVGALVNAYIMVAVIASITINIMGSMSGLLGGLASKIGLSLGTGTNMMYLFNFVLMPVLTVALIMAVSGMLPKYPVTYVEPYLSLFTSVPLGILVYSLFMLLGGANVFVKPDMVSFMLAIGGLTAMFVVISVPPYIAWRRIEKREKGLMESLSMFLNDLASMRKSGLSAEKSIIECNRTRGKYYGKFKIILDRIVNALHLGYSLSKAVDIAILEYKNWFLRVILTFLVDSLEYGGGEPEILDSIAGYARSLAELEKEFRKNLKSYMFLPYMGTVLNTVVTIMMLWLGVNSLTMGGSLQGVSVGLSPRDIASTAYTMLTGLIFNAWLSGLFIGKSVEMTLASGFKHALLLVLITGAVGIIAVTQILMPVLSALG